MKLKFKKQKIASLRITHKLIGGNTTNGETRTGDLPEGFPTDANNCGITEHDDCTSKVNPTNCHTNDTTLRTWDPDIINPRVTEFRC